MSVINKKTEKEMAARDLSWPKLKWRATPYLTIVSVLLALVLFVAPGLSEGRFDKNRILIAVIIIVIPFVVFTGIPWLYKAMRNIIKRIIYYPDIQRVYIETEKDFTELHKAMRGYLMNQIVCRKLEIQLAAFKDGKMHLMLLRKAEVDIEVGDVVEVIDSSDYKSMGQFKITEVRSEVYYAEEVSHVDKLWLGYVRMQGETKFLPNMIALRIRRGENNE